MKDENIKKVLLLGSGALKIGEAGEFDYSRFDLAEALREEGIETALMTEIATVQTSEGVADQILLPASAAILRRERVIQKERPDASVVRQPSTVVGTLLSGHLGEI